jgi:hypothetical protein
MNILEALKSTSEDGFDTSKKYLDATYKYNKLKAFQILTYTVSGLSKLFLIGSVLIIGLIFILIASAIALGDYLNSASLGYLFIGVFLIVIGFLIFLIRKAIDKKIITKISQQFFEIKK